MSRAISLFLIGGAILLLVVGGLALGGWFLLNQSSGPNLTRWVPPTESIESQAVRPVTSIRLLAGESETTALDDALARGNWQGAFALLAYATELNDSARIGNLMLIAARLEGEAVKTTNQTIRTQNIAQAARLYQYTVVFTILSPELSDFTRAQNLLQAARELRTLNVADNARYALDQAYLIAQFSPYLANAARAQLLRQCADAYQTQGVGTRATQAYKLANDFAQRKDENIAAPITTTLTFPTIPISETANLKQATAARVRAARDLADELDADETQVPADLVTALGDKLYAEDTARMAFYQAELKKTNDPLTRINLLRAQTAWLTLKWRIARKGFGVSLVSEWERDAAKIGDAVSDTLDELYLTAQPLTQKSGVRTQEALIRTELGWGYWGLYKNFDVNDLRARLNDANDTLRERFPDELRVDSFKRGDQILFLLVPIELYGKGEQALPK